MKKRTLLAALLMFGFAASPVFSAGKLLDTGAGNLNKNVTVENGVISIRPEKGKKAVAFRSAYVLPSDERQKYFRLSFSCRFPETPKTVEVGLVLQQAHEKDREAKRALYWLLDPEKGSRVTGWVTGGYTGIPAWKREEFDFPAMNETDWYEFQIARKNTIIEVSMKIDGKFQPIGATRADQKMLFAGLTLAAQNAVDVKDVKLLPEEESRPEKKKTNRKTSAAGKDEFITMESSDSILCPASEKFRIEFRTNLFPAYVQWKMLDGTNSPKYYNLTSFTENITRKYKKTVEEEVDGKKTKKRIDVVEKYRINDAGMKFFGYGMSRRIFLFSRARISSRYHANQIPDMLKELEKNGTPGSRDLHRLEFIRIDEEGKHWQIDYKGSLLADVKLEHPLQNVQLFMPYGTEYKITELEKERIHPLLHLVEPPGEAVRVEKYKGVSVKVCKPEDAFDTSLCKVNLGSFMLECDGYLSRQAFDSPLDSYIRKVPNTQYIRAHVICSLEPGLEKEVREGKRNTIMTVRLANFYSPYCEGTATDMITHNFVELPLTEDDPLPPNVRRIGKNKFLASLDLDIGKIQDITFMRKLSGIDLEVLGDLRRFADNYYVNSFDKPSLIPSIVRVHGVTLEKSPALLRVDSGVIGNYYVGGEVPFSNVTVTAVRHGKYQIRTEVYDLDNKLVQTNTKNLDLKKAGEKVEFKNSFEKAMELGHYRFVTTLLPADGKREYVKCTGSFIRFAPDTRKATPAESPFFTWNFGGAHGTPTDRDLVCRIARRVGSRQTMLWNDKYSEEEMKSYGLIRGPFNPLRNFKAKDKAGRAKEMDQKIQEWIRRYPSTRVAMIFHERGGGGPAPLELLGEKTPITPAQKKIDRMITDEAIEVAEAWRRNAPHIRLIVGNSGSSLNIMAQLFREGYPKEYIDTLGEESVGQTVSPERSTAGSFWDLKELARIYGYNDVGVEASYEWKGRKCPTFSDRERAAWRIRDILIALAWNSKIIPIPSGPFHSDCYDNTVWGGGVFTRWPLYQPYPIFCASSVVTQMMDCVEFVRMVPTGSKTVYALEFKRKAEKTADGQKDEYVYALWSARGEVDAQVKNSVEKTLRTDLYGRAKELTGNDFTLKITPEATYLTQTGKIQSISVSMQRTYPWETHPGQEKAQVACAMDDVNQWTLAMGEDKRMRPPTGLNPYRPGAFKLEGVEDILKGKCLELTLLREGEVAPRIQEYAFMRLNTPVEIPGTPNTVGVWVKGNSSWAKLYFEIIDAEGEKWMTGGSGTYYDWPDRLGVNFDGWHFLQFPLNDLSPVKVPCPGEGYRQWRYGGGKGDRKITFPIKLYGVGVSMSRKTLNILEMEDPPTLSLRFKDFSGY